jgi:serine/threonine-protein phosphatase 2A regulatory subunit B
MTAIPTLPNKSRSYSSSRGSIKLADLRAAALCDRHSKIFEEEDDPANKSFFSEIISSISDVKFSQCGRYIVSRYGFKGEIVGK